MCGSAVATAFVSRIDVCCCFDAAVVTASPICFVIFNDITVLPLAPVPFFLSCCKSFKLSEPDVLHIFDCSQHGRDVLLHRGMPGEGLHEVELEES